MKIIEAEPRENVRLYAGFLLLFALCFYAFLIRPVGQQLAAVRSQYQSLRAEILSGKAKARELLGYARSVNGLKSEVAGLEQQLRSGNQVLLLFKDAEESARHALINLGAITVAGPEVVEGDVTRQPITVTATGSLERLLHFVRHLERLAYPVRVTAVSLDARRDGASGAAAGKPAEAGAPAEASAAPLPAGHLAATIKVEMYSLGAGGVLVSSGRSAGAGAEPAGGIALGGAGTRFNPVEAVRSALEKVGEGK